MLMVAIREHGYLGRRRPTGEKYEVRDTKDAIVLRVAGLARNATPLEKAAHVAHKLPAPVAAESLVQPSPDVMVPNITTDNTADEPIVYENRSVVRIREEEPEVIVEEASPKDKERRRKHGRRYKRNDMVPED